ncbi:flavin reductase family protein [Streptomyces sp. NBC_00481]|nr:flavin reductase family protein [Streptomyces sp. NBC_00481]WRY97685.1 flavin reductase family protein [Streptomyces sp. NBC_00481]
MDVVMGHAGMAAAAVRYLKADTGSRAAATDAADRRRGTTIAQPVVEALPRPDLRCVGENERAPVDQATFRRVLGNFATGVTVITAPALAPAPAPAPTRAADDSDPDPDPTELPTQLPTEHPDDHPAGFACQSFSSLSLDPPLVAFMVGRTSTTWPRIARAGVFCVNVLGADQSELCRRFAVSGADKFAGVAHDPAPATGSPRLTGAAAWIDCTIHAVHTGGDHLIVVGRVEALGTGGEAVPPLLFHRGRFGELRA